MPAVGILKKPPHPDPPPAVKPPRPPKPKRGIPPPPPRTAEAKRSQEILFADEDEPTTEESYDYKDIDFASDIFDWRVPPPRPKPPRLQANGVAHKVAESAPVVVSETKTSAYDTRPSALEERLEPVAEEEAEKNATGERGLKAGKLAAFMAEHEGTELTMEDVRQLELLLDEAESEERDHVTALGEDDQKNEDDLRDEHEGKEDENNDVMHECNGEGLQNDGQGIRQDGDGIQDDGEPKGTGKVRFSDENERDEEQGQEDDRPMPHSDYGIMQFFQAGGKKPKKGKDAGTYEPVGRQDLRFVRPDMSGYRPPEPSDVGDPFSWRRREKPHHYLHGYGPEEPTPSMHKILGGCQQVEEMIVARDLTPPGMLFDSLGRKKRVRKVRAPSPPPRPPPPVPPKMRTPSPLPPIPTQTEPEPEQDDEMPMDEMDEERQLEMEKQILPDWSVVETLESVSVKEDVLVAGSLAEGRRDLAATPHVRLDVEDVIVPVDAASYLTGDSAVSPPTDAGEADHPHNESAPKSDDTEETIREAAPRRVSRRDSARRRPPRPSPPRVLSRPIPPERRKRVASAEPPLTAFEQTPPPRSKPKRSASFHTADEIRKRIDVQAQSYLRTPRRKDRLSCAYLDTSPSASAALNYGSLRRDHRRPLTPVYSHVNKEAPRRRETGVQTNGGEDAESLPPVPPPKLRDLEPPSPTPEPAELNEPAPKDPDFSSPAEKSPEDSVVPGEFLALSKPSEPSEKSPEDSVVPGDFLTLSKPSEWSEKSLEDSVVPGEFLNLSKPKKESEEKTGESMPASGRPLPPPPAPPRHRGHKAKPFAFDGPVVICGIVPKGEEGKMAVLPDLKVLRLSVVQLDASMIRVGQIEAEHLVARRIDASVPGPSPQGPQDPGPVPDPKMLEEADAVKAEVPPENNNNVQSDGGSDPETLQGSDSWTQRLKAPEPQQVIRVASPVEGFNVWDAERECASPTNTMTSTTSGSASYVTCDETLHEGSEANADEDDLGFGLDEDDDELDGRGTGCSTPTEMELTLGSDIPLAMIDPGIPPILAPPTEPFLPAPAAAVHPHLPMDTDTDENFNSFGGDESRDPSNTVGI